MKENETVQEFFPKISVIINKIRRYGDNINDQKIVEKILRSLSIKIEHVIVAIEEAKRLIKSYNRWALWIPWSKWKKDGQIFYQSSKQAFQSEEKITDNKNTKKEQENKDNSSSQQRNLTGGGRGKQNFRGWGI